MIEDNLISAEEQQQIDWMWNAIPEEDRKGMTKEDILFVLDAMDDYLEEAGLVEYDEETEEINYLEGDVDETEQLSFVLEMAENDGRKLTSSQVQIIMDAEYQYGLEQGYYEE